MFSQCVLLYFFFKFFTLENAPWKMSSLENVPLENVFFGQCPDTVFSGAVEFFQVMGREIYSKIKNSLPLFNKYM